MMQPSRMESLQFHCYSLQSFSPDPPNHYIITDSDLEASYPGCMLVLRDNIKGLKSDSRRSPLWE